MTKNAEQPGDRIPLPPRRSSEQDHIIRIETAAMLHLLSAGALQDSTISSMLEDPVQNIHSNDEQQGRECMRSRVVPVS